MGALSYTAAKISADPAKGSVLRNFEAGAATAPGKAVYIDSSEKVQNAIGTALATSIAVGIVVGVPNQYGETTIAAGERCTVCLFGPVYGWASLSAEKLGYVSKTTAGQIEDTAPTDAYQYTVGYPVEDDVFWVHPGIAAPVSA
jgi:hypothetical protein